MAAVGVSRAPLVLARDRLLRIPGALGEALPSVQRGSVVAVGGAVGSGATSTVLALAAAATIAGEWAALVQSGDGDALGGLAAAEAGVDLARFAVVRDVPRDQWATVVAALLDGMSVVIASVAARQCAPVMPVGSLHALANAPRCSSHSRPMRAAWPAEAALRIDACSGLVAGVGPGRRRPLGSCAGMGDERTRSCAAGDAPPALERTG